MLEFLRSLWFRIRSRVRRDSLDAELADELRAHREFLEFGESEYRELQRYAREIGVTFFATASGLMIENVRSIAMTNLLAGAS